VGKTIVTTVPFGQAGLALRFGNGATHAVILAGEVADPNCQDPGVLCD
jgi:hypothetical protein